MEKHFVLIIDDKPDMGVAIKESLEKICKEAEKSVNVLHLEHIPNKQGCQTLVLASANMINHNHRAITDFMAKNTPECILIAVSSDGDILNEALNHKDVSWGWRKSQLMHPVSESIKKVLSKFLD